MAVDILPATVFYFTRLFCRLISLPMRINHLAVDASIVTFHRLNYESPISSVVKHAVPNTRALYVLPEFDSQSGDTHFCMFIKLFSNDKCVVTSSSG